MTTKIGRSRTSEKPQEFEGVIQYFDSWGWGVAADGSTICLGREAAVKEAIANPKLSSGFPDVDQVIELERNLLKEMDNGSDRTIPGKRTYQSRAIKAGSKRSRPMLDFGRRPAGARRFANR